MNITATDFIKFDGEGKNGFPSSGAFSYVGSGAEGKAGGVTISTRSLELTNGAQLSASTFGKGDAGGITIDARDAVSFDSGNVLSTVRVGAVGSGGNININTGSLSLINGGQIISETRSIGKGGGININVQDLFVIKKSSIFTNSDGTGDGGDLTIMAREFFVEDASQVSASNFKQGNTGAITLVAEKISLDGDVSISSNLGSTSAPIVNVTFDERDGQKIPKITTEPRQNTIFPNAQGNSGNIRINAISLFVTNGARLTTSNYGLGQAGDINIDVDRDIVFAGSSSGAFSSVEQNAVGAAGTIDITTNNLTLTNGARLVASNLGQGSAGDIKIRATNKFLVDGVNRQDSLTGVFAESQTANGGNIELTGNLLFLRRGGLISTISRVEGEGGIDGNVDIRTKFLVAIPRENSDVIAIGSGRSPGSNIQVRSQGIFGTKIRNEQTPESDIVATGQVTSNVLDAELSTELLELPSKLVDVASLIANSCIARGSRQQEGTFVITGSGSLPSRPGEALMSLYTFGTVRTVSNTAPSANSTRRPWQKGDPIVEAQGVYRLSSGQLVLSRECAEY